jgi:hypothetical protein
MNLDYDGQALEKGELLEYCTQKEKVLNKQLLDLIIQHSAARSERPATQKNKMPREVEAETAINAIRAGVQKIRELRTKFNSLKETKED